MKKLLFLTSLLIAFCSANAQWVTNVGSFNNYPKDMENGRLFTFVATIDSLDTLYSHSFNFGTYENSDFMAYPISASYYITSALGKPHVEAVIQGTNDGGTTWITMDTIVVNDSAETAVFGSFNLNTFHATAYRLLVCGMTYGTGATSANRSDTYMKLYIFATKRPFR